MSTINYPGRIIIFAMLFACNLTPVYAGNDALMTLLQALHDNGTINTETYELVKQVAQQEQTNSRWLRQRTGRK